MSKTAKEVGINLKDYNSWKKGDSKRAAKKEKKKQAEIIEKINRQLDNKIGNLRKSIVKHFRFNISISIFTKVVK